MIVKYLDFVDQNVTNTLKPNIILEKWNGQKHIEKSIVFLIVFWFLCDLDKEMLNDTSYAFE